MGGERETLVPQSRAAGTPTQLGHLRVHDSGKETHFHDDNLKLKAAVPNAKWYAAWQDLCQAITAGETRTWSHVDTANKATVFVKIEVDTGRANDRVEVNAYAWLLPTTFNDVFQKLQDYTKPSK